MRTISSDEELHASTPFTAINAFPSKKSTIRCKRFREQLVSRTFDTSTISHDIFEASVCSHEVMVRLVPKQKGKFDDSPINNGKWHDSRKIRTPQLTFLLITEMSFRDVLVQPASFSTSLFVRAEASSRRSNSSATSYSSNSTSSPSKTCSTYENVLGPSPPYQDANPDLIATRSPTPYVRSRQCSRSKVIIFACVILSPNCTKRSTASWQSEETPASPAY